MEASSETASTIAVGAGDGPDAARGSASARAAKALSRLTVLNKLGYGVGDFAANVVFQCVTLYLLFFFTDVFMIGAGAAGMIFFISKLWNAVMDPSMGIVADRTHTRWGRNRPFLLFGAVPLGVVFFLLFAAPNLSQTGKVVWALVMFLLFSTAYSLINIPYGALTANMTQDAKERSSLTAFRMMFAIIGTLIVAGGTLPLVGLFSTPVVGFRWVGIIFGALCVAVNIITFASVRERVMPPKDKSMSFVADLKLVARNRPFLIVTVATIVQMMGINIVAAMINYYFKYNLQAESYTPIALLGFFAVAMVALPLWVVVSKKWGKKATFIIGMTILAFVFLALRFVSSGSIWLTIGLLMLGGVGMSTQYLCPWAMIPDTVEYAQLKTGLRREGILYGFFNFAFKFSAALAGVLVGVGLGAFHYVPNAEQHAGALNGISLMMTIIPFALVLLGTILVFFYPITEAKHAQIVAELNEKA